MLGERQKKYSSGGNFFELLPFFYVENCCFLSIFFWGISRFRGCQGGGGA